MGAEGIYDEDSLFGLWSEERQVWDDILPKSRRDMTRKFYKFTATHPRQGKCVRNIAFLEGRYAAPFNGFICGTEQDPHYSVWGLFGNEAPEWGHGQPEKCRQLLDVLMPGARAFADKRRKSDGTLLATYKKKDGITLGEMQLAAMNVLRCVMDLKEL